jgi:hypothetical protein
VKVPRFRISTIMVVVAVVALDFGMIRAMPVIGPPTIVLLVLGALPMANVLPVVLLSGHRRPENRPFRQGFVLFGAMALALYVAMTLTFPLEIVSLVTPLSVYLMKTIGSDPPLLLFANQAFALVVMMVLPQVVFALIGGFLFQRFMITSRISKPPDRTPA